MRKKEKILVFGASGHAKVIIDAIEKEANYEIIGLIDSSKVLGQKTLGYKVLGKEEDLANIVKDNRIEGGADPRGDDKAIGY